MVKRTVESELRADVTNYVAGVGKASTATDKLAASQEKASESTDKLAGKAKSQSESWKTVSTNLAITGAAAAAFGIALPTKAAADFEAAMAQVSATGPEAKRSLSDLAVAARESATDVDGAGYSAVQAAGGIEALIKAGVSVEDVMGGAMAGSLALAAAGEMDVADAAEVASGAMTQFKLEGRDVGHIADLLAAGAGKAMGDVSDLSQALAQSGLVAAQAGLSIEETTGTLSAFASAGLLGSDAGTSFRNMLLRLANPAGEAADTMERLGIAAYDAQGNFVGIPALADSLQRSLAGLSEEQRQAALATIFGTDAIRSASIMYEQGADGMQAWIDATNDAGYAQEVASERLNSLNGDLQKLWGVIGEVAIAAGEANTGPLRDFVQVLTDLLRAAAEDPDGLQHWAIAIGAVGVAAATLGISMKIVTAVVEFRDALSSLRKPATDAAKAMDGAATSTGKWGGRAKTAASVAGKLAAGLLAVGAAGQVLDMLSESAADIDAVTAAMTRLEKGTGNLDAAFKTASGGSIMGDWADGVNSLDSAMERFANRGWKYLDGIDSLGSAISGTSTDVDDLRTQFGLIDQQLSSMDSSDAQRAFQEVADSAANAGLSTSDLIDLFPAYAAQLQQIAADQGQAALTGDELVAAMRDGIPIVDEAGNTYSSVSAKADALAQSEEDAAAKAEALAEKLGGWATSDANFVNVMSAWDAVIQKNKDVAQAAADASGEAGKSWEDFYDGHAVALDDYLTELEGQVEAQTNWERNMVLLAGRASQGVIDHLTSLGPDGAELVQALVDGSDEQLARMEAAFGQRGEEATGAFAEELDRADEVWSALARTAGSNSVEYAKEQFEAGKWELRDIIDKYDLTATLNADTSPAERATRAALARISNMSASVRINAYHANGFDAPVATGGYGQDVADAYGIKLRDGGQARRRYEGLLEGPGTTTSDSIAAWLSRKEFVTNADATDYYGTNVMYAMNSKAIPRSVFEAIGFAGGGSPSVATPARPPSFPTSLSATVDSASIASAVSRSVAAELRGMRIVDASGRTSDHLRVIIDGLDRIGV